VRCRLRASLLPPPPEQGGPARRRRATPDERTSSTHRHSHARPKGAASPRAFDPTLCVPGFPSHHSGSAGGRYIPRRTLKPPLNMRLPSTGMCALSSLKSLSSMIALLARSLSARDA
jgi:hypothetical protein